MNRRRRRYRWRTQVRRHLPFWLIDRGVAQKGKKDCDLNEWYQFTDDEMECYHRGVGRKSGRIAGLPDGYWTDVLGEEVGQVEHFASK